MTTDRQLLEMALEALEEVRDAKILALELKPSYHNIISSLHARLAQPDLAKVGEVGVWGEQEHKYWCASLTQMLASLPPKPAPCDCKKK